MFMLMHISKLYNRVCFCFRRCRCCCCGCRCHESDCKYSLFACRYRKSRSQLNYIQVIKLWAIWTTPISSSYGCIIFYWALFFLGAIKYKIECIGLHGGLRIDCTGVALINDRGERENRGTFAQSRKRLFLFRWFMFGIIATIHFIWSGHTQNQSSETFCIRFHWQCSSFLCGFGRVFFSSCLCSSWNWTSLRFVRFAFFVLVRFFLLWSIFFALFWTFFSSWMTFSS